MAVPKRQEIREALRSMLAGATDAADKVYSNRTSAFWRSELPCISTFFRDEEATPRDLSGKSYIRKALLAVEIHAEADESLDDLLDKIADQVETVIFSDVSLKGTVLSCVYQGSDFDFSADALKPIGVLSQTYQITFKNGVL